MRLPCIAFACTLLAQPVLAEGTAEKWSINVKNGFQDTSKSIVTANVQKPDGSYLGGWQIAPGQTKTGERRFVWTLTDYAPAGCVLSFRATIDDGVDRGKTLKTKWFGLVVEDDRTGHTYIVEGKVNVCEAKEWVVNEATARMK